MEVPRLGVFVLGLSAGLIESFSWWKYFFPNGLVNFFFLLHNLDDFKDQLSYTPSSFNGIWLRPQSSVLPVCLMTGTGAE